MLLPCNNADNIVWLAVACHVFMCIVQKYGYIVCFSLMPPTTGVKRHYVFGWSSVRPLSVRPLTTTSNDTISLYLVEEFQWNSAQIFAMWVGIAEKVFKVRGQRLRSQQDHVYFCGRRTFQSINQSIYLSKCKTNSGPDTKGGCNLCWQVPIKTMLVRATNDNTSQRKKSSWQKNV